MGRFWADLVPPIWAAACPAPPRLFATHLRPIRRTRAPTRCTHLARGPGPPLRRRGRLEAPLCAHTGSETPSAPPLGGVDSCRPHRSTLPARGRDTCSSLGGPGWYGGLPPAAHRGGDPTARSGFTPANRAAALTSDHLSSRGAGAAAGHLGMPHLAGNSPTRGCRCAPARVDLRAPVLRPEQICSVCPVLPSCPG